MKTKEQILDNIKQINGELSIIEEDLSNKHRSDIKDHIERAKFDFLKIRRLILITKKDTLEWVLFGVVTC